MRKNMKSVKATEGTPYDAPKHYTMWGIIKILHEQTRRTGASLSHFLPNGSAEMSSSDKERVYYVIRGSITVKGKTEEHMLEPGDLIYIAPGEEREIVTNGTEPATVLVIIATP